MTVRGSLVGGTPDRGPGRHPSRAWIDADHTYRQESCTAALLAMRPTEDQRTKAALKKRGGESDGCGDRGAVHRHPTGTAREVEGVLGGG